MLLFYCLLFYLYVFCLFFLFFLFLFIKENNNLKIFVNQCFEIILVGRGGLVALLGLSSWSLAVIVRLFLAVPWVCLQFVILVLPDHTHLPFFDFFNSFIYVAITIQLHNYQ